MKGHNRPERRNRDEDSNRPAEHDEVFGAEFEGRSERFERQVARIREIWQTARESDSDFLTEPENLIHHGPGQRIAEEVAAYADAGIDTLILFAEIPSLDQVDLLAEHVLPNYAG
jgi:hypothetical protein